MDCPGRRYAPDRRDGLYPLVATLNARVARVEPFTLWALFEVPRDQGRAATAVGWAWKHWLMARGRRGRMYEHHPTAWDIYRYATRLDEWEDGEDDPLFGTSVRAGARAVRAYGHLERYEWTWSVEAARRWLCGRDASGAAVGGPLVLGCNWYDSLAEPDAHGYARIGANARSLGGHAVAVLGYSQRRGVFLCANSRGADWGKQGRFTLSGETLERLLREDGELCTGVDP